MSAPDGTRRRISRQAIAAVSTGALALASIATALALGVATPEAQQKPTPPPAAATPEPLDIETPKPAPVTDKDEAEDAAEVTVAQLVDATNQILQRADGEIAGIETIAAGFVRGELEALAAERAEEGLKQVGDAKVASVDIAKADLESDPATMTIEVCIDVSDIDVVDAGGNSLKDSLYNPGHPVLHLYGVEHIDGVWKLTTHEIPEDARCA
ncbi:hypothetical protein ACFFGH_31845 [Lysobacter korlensis]|uniref:Secreted protein n=1 Tax=Lysobacter korlensis TaxID=553636 RepID=A0ABV6RZP1_9GAMM